MSTSTVPRTGLDRLAAVLDGSLARPGDPDPRRGVGRCRIGSNQ